MASKRMSAALSVLKTRNFSKMFLRARRLLEFSHGLGHQRKCSERSVHADPAHSFSVLSRVRWVSKKLRGIRRGRHSWGRSVCHPYLVRREAACRGSCERQERTSMRGLVLTTVTAIGIGLLGLSGASAVPANGIAVSQATAADQLIWIDALE